MHSAVGYRSIAIRTLTPLELLDVSILAGHVTLIMALTRSLS